MTKKTKAERFIEEYINNGFNGTEAYIVVYKTVNRQTAAKGATRILKKVNIAEEIAKTQLELSPSNIKKTDLIDSIVMVRDKAIAAGKFNDALKANEILVKMFGYNQASEIKHSGNISFDFGGTLEDE